MLTSSRYRKDTPPGFVSPGIRLSPDERVVNRSTCWRPACRDEWAHARTNTIAFLASGATVAWCHRRVYDDLGYRADIWRHGAQAA